VRRHIGPADELSSIVVVAVVVVAGCVEPSPPQVARMRAKNRRRAVVQTEKANAILSTEAKARREVRSVWSWW
jgi:hypothetical protein